MTLHRGINIDEYIARGEAPPGEGPGDGSASEKDVFQDQYAYEFSPEPEVGSVPIPDGESGDFSRERFERLNRRVREADPDYSSRIHQDDNLRVAQALSDYIDLSEAVRGEVLDCVERADFSDFGSRSIDELILGVIRASANQRRTWENRISQDDNFRAAMESMELDLTDIRKISRSIEDGEIF